MQKFPYYAITVRRYNVLFRHTDWLKKTQELYNEILLFYYRLYLETFPDQQPGTQEALRILETLTIVGRDKQPVPTPLPWKKIPLYFDERRSTQPQQRQRATWQEEHRNTLPRNLQNPLPFTRERIVTLRTIRFH